MRHTFKSTCLWHYASIQQGLHACAALELLRNSRDSIQGNICLEMEQELLVRPEDNSITGATVVEESLPPQSYEDPMDNIEETADDFLAASREALEAIATEVEDVEPVRQELNPLHMLQHTDNDADKPSEDPLEPGVSCCRLQ